MRSFLYKVCVVITLAWALVLLPMPGTIASMMMKDGIVVITAVFAIGKLLYDTLFFNHYRP